MGFWDIVKSVGSAVIEQAQANAEREMERQRRIAESPAYQHGKADTRTGIVLSAPGQAEEKAGRPAAGQTGKTLNKTLAALHKADPKRFPSKDKDDYRIVNAVPDVHYKGATGRTEGTSAEIRERKNQARMKKSLEGMDTVVALGNKAQEAVHGSGFDGTVLKGSHPSMQNINRNYQAEGATAAERSEKRIDAYAKEIASSDKKKKK